MTTSSLTPQEAHRWVRIGVLSALAMLLGYAETFIPIPIPGVKLGLANIAVLVALDGHDISGAFAISAIKVLSTEPHLRVTAHDGLRCCRIAASLRWHGPALDASQHAAAHALHRRRALA